MRQQNVTGYELVSGDLGRVIGAGEEFDHPVLITGCASLEDAEDGTPEDEDGTTETGAPDDPQAAMEATEDAPAPQNEPEDKTRAKGTRR